jgi:glycosyltransferase involved in cell wall biosynthesis
MNVSLRDQVAPSERAILILDMSFTLKMVAERQLDRAIESRELNGFFGNVISVHPFAGLFELGDQKYGHAVLTKFNRNHLFVEGKIGISRFLRFLPLLNLLLAQIQLFRLLLRLAKDAKIDVVRVGDPYYLGLMGWILSRILQVPMMIRVCFNYDQYFESTKRAVFPRLFRYRSIEKIIERFVLPRCALVAGANRDNLEYAIANGASPKNCYVFRYGNLLHPAHFVHPRQREIGRKLLLEIGVEGDFLATVSRLEKMKQPEHNLLALKKLHDLGHTLKFVFIGDGSMRRELEELAQDLGLAANVVFVGNRTQTWIAEVLPLARVVLSPHMGRALTEACLAAAPIVAYNYDWQGEIIESGVTGELVPNGAWEEMAYAAERFINDPSVARANGEAARKRAMEMMDPSLLDDHERRAYLKLFGDLNGRDTLTS